MHYPFARKVRGGGMLYQAYQAHSDLMVPLRALAGGGGERPVGR